MSGSGLSNVNSEVMISWACVWCRKIKTLIAPHMNSGFIPVKCSLKASISKIWQPESTPAARTSNTVKLVFFPSFCKLWSHKRSKCQVLPCSFGHWFLLVLWKPPWCSSAVRHAGGWNWSQCSNTPLDILGFHVVKYLPGCFFISLDFAGKSLENCSPSSDVTPLNSLPTSPPRSGFDEKRRNRGN